MNDRDGNFEYAPVIIPTLNRYHHLKRCLESLNNNELAENTDVYISVDFPPNQNYFEGYHEVISFLKSEFVPKFRNLVVFYQKDNLGPENNVSFLINESIPSSDRYFILTEDDNEFAPSFLKYMNECLHFFEDDDRVLKVCGYAPSNEWRCEESNVFMLDNGCAWGMGTWRKKHNECLEWINIDHFWEILKNRNKCKMLYKRDYQKYWNLVEACIADLYDKKNVFVKRNEEDIRDIDYTEGLFMTLKGRVSVFPQYSLVRNWGFDGSGVNCGVIEEKVAPPFCQESLLFEPKLSLTWRILSENIEKSRFIGEKGRADRARVLRVLAILGGPKFARTINNIYLYFQYKLWKIRKH